jgi:hypothetical protein
VVAGALVAERALDQHEVRRGREVRRDAAGGGDAEQQPAARGEELLGQQHREGGADRPADRADGVADSRRLEAHQLRVVAGPAAVRARAAGLREMGDEVAVGVEQADRRHRLGRQPLLAPGLAQQGFRLEHRRRVVMLVGQQGGGDGLGRSIHEPMMGLGRRLRQR